MPAGVVEQVTFTDSSITVYAVWGWDTDNDGKPDITQNPSITSSAGKNGSIAPEGKVYVPAGNSQKFDFTPDTGYAVDRGTIDGTAYVNNGVNLLPGMDAWEKWESYTFAEDVYKRQAQNTGKVLTHNYILNKIWSSALPSDTPSLRVFMATLRKKIEPDPSHPRYIQTHIGVGYRMIRQPDEEAGAESEA